MESYPGLYVPATDALAGLPREGPHRFVVGRSPRANLCMPDMAWSREQFCIRLEQGGYYLEQLSQKAPTLVNGSRLGAPHRLQHGDKISVSSITMVYLERADAYYRKPQGADAPVDADAGLTRKADENDRAVEPVRRIASGYILFIRDARGELVYGKALGRWVKQATRAKGAAPPRAKPAAAAKR